MDGAAICYCRIVNGDVQQLLVKLMNFTRMFSLTDESVRMGFLQSTFSLLIGAGCGIYIAQNYNVPIKKLVMEMMDRGKKLEESYKKPGNDKNKDSK
ncbi:hypothetical protein C2845_PM05G10870 [Panicum miliaceum]|uniref:Uncharacterized protein n=1 Tax=Panicum miliaceum TaxID=4540 RepID=A0A3L6SW90_PANMI|nr:hypothetical protein C2845_PM05G10870 [Panicum miliaceum]